MKKAWASYIEVQAKKVEDNNRKAKEVPSKLISIVDSIFFAVL